MRKAATAKKSKKGPSKKAEFDLFDDDDVPSATTTASRTTTNDDAQGVSAKEGKRGGHTLSIRSIQNSNDSHSNRTNKINQSIEEALKYGKKEWKRSKIMIVGEGRAGKTALTNSIMGKTYVDTESTIGINQLTCNVKYATAGGDEGGWKESDKPPRELESALASMIHSSGTEATPKPVDHADILTFMRNSQPDTISSESNTKENEHRHQDIDKSDEIQLPIDEELVLKCLSSSVENESDLTIALFDYGGQSVFNVIHHLFLTRNGVYILVFNMEWLVDNSPDRGQCLEYMRFWLNSIAVHTMKEDGVTAPVVIVGTRKDSIKDAAIHASISTLLYETFRNNPCWPNVIENEAGVGKSGRTNFSFFPVDNTLGRKGDPTLTHLMKVVEKTMNDAPYTHKEVPLTWMKTLDMFLAGRSEDGGSQSRSFITLKEAESIAMQNGVNQQDVVYLLSFMHDMGMLMWNDEPELREVVILDPIAYMVTPATTVICKHKPDSGDCTHHITPLHKECQKKHRHEWSELIDHGILHDSLLDILWHEWKGQSTTLIALMVKFGLFVPLITASTNTLDDSTSSGKQFLIPALLSRLPETEFNFSSEWCDNVRMPCTCVFVFSSSPKIATFPTITQEDLLTSGFLPSGLFERIIGKALTWCQSTSRGGFHLRDAVIHKNLAILQFGSQRFRLITYPQVGCIRVDIDGRAPLVVHDRLLELVQKVISECMKSLVVLTALLYTGPNPPSHEEYQRFLSLAPSQNHGQDAGMMLLPLNVLRDIVSSKSVLSRPGGRRLMTAAEVGEKYGTWLQIYQLLEHYDVFLSYRWNEFDKHLVRGIFDSFTSYTIGKESRPVEVFLDVKRLKSGRKFDYDFFRALLKSDVLVPVISYAALQVMASEPHETGDVDNLLLEWTLAWILWKVPDRGKISSLKRIYPIMIGRIASVDKGLAASTEVVDFFSEKAEILASLPNSVHQATWKQAIGLLQESQVGMDLSSANPPTTRELVTELTKFLCYPWKTGSTVAHFVEEVYRNVLVECLEEISVATSTANVDVTSQQPQQPQQQGLSLIQCINMLKEQLGISTTAAKLVIEEALQITGDEDMKKECDKLPSMLLKAQYLVKHVIG